MGDEAGFHHFETGPLPTPPLWRVPVEPATGYEDGEFRIRARTAEKAAQRARSYMGLTPTGPAERIEEDDHGSD